MEKTTILIIEDDESQRRVLEYNLRKVGYAVLTASDGEAGLSLLRKNPIDVVLTDVRMPGMDGFQVLEKVKEIDSEIIVIIVTAFGTIEKAVAAMKKGAFDYITKPFNREELLLVVERGLKIKRLERENNSLREELVDKFSLNNVVGTSSRMKDVFKIVHRVAKTESTVLILGESGTGKELIAKAIHYNSERFAKPMITVNCTAIPDHLLESELFGHKKGSFTGAIRDKIGKFEQANGGSLFLDEIGELKIDLQAKILRGLQEKEIDKIGENHPIKVNVRVIAATNCDLFKAVKEGKFREDLYYRLSVIPVQIPPLRERKEDIPLLIDYFMRKFGAPREVRLDSLALKALGNYAWPGNVRELENTIERVLILRKHDIITLEDLPANVSVARGSNRDSIINLPDEGVSLRGLEREVIVQALERCQWNQTKTALFLRIPRHILLYRMDKYNISR